MGNAGHAANMELAKLVPGVDVVVSAPTDVPGADFPQMVSALGRYCRGFWWDELGGSGIYRRRWVGGFRGDIADGPQELVRGARS